jgi:hypothetical protein
MFGEDTESGLLENCLPDSQFDQPPFPRRRYWYRIYVGECPVCGKDKGYRERVYGPPPSDPRKRYVQMPDTETYDDCLG